MFSAKPRSCRQRTANKGPFFPRFFLYLDLYTWAFLSQWRASSWNAMLEKGRKGLDLFVQLAFTRTAAYQYCVLDRGRDLDGDSIRTSCLD